ncbi:hypothetical protein QJS66_19780 [Kocuria rhizophila]|nr:hypothetical protein QJS66_19780 [Kocuria rhizophila]
MVAVRPEPAPWFEPALPQTEARGFAEAASAVGPWPRAGSCACARRGRRRRRRRLRYADGQEQLTRLHVARAVWDAQLPDGSVLAVLYGGAGRGPRGAGRTCPRP